MRSKCLAIVGLSVALLTLGCHKRTPTATLPPVPAPASAAAAIPSPLELADRAFISGNYDEAARGYENYLRSTDKGPLDEVLFHLALTYALRPAPAGDWSRAAAMFKQLIEEYPTSPLKAPAMLILSLRSELDQGIADAKQRDLKVKQLTTELDRLKKIDADRRKRP